MTNTAKSIRGREAERRGRLAETMCLARLWLTGWRVIAHRLAGKRGSGLGEIDIVAKRGQVLAFIEVKARESVESGLESITPMQRQRIQAAAIGFLSHRPMFSACAVRFDVMIVAGGLWPKHVPDAWRLE